MRIFQTSNDNLTEIEEEMFDVERTIQNMVEKNLGSVFSSLQFIESEFQVDDLRPDIIAFDSEKRSFVIIAYKNLPNHSLVDRGVSYYHLLHEKAENFVLLYNKKLNKNLGISDINWDETRIIFISTKYNKYQKMANGLLDLPIELHEIKKYQNNIISLDRVADFTAQNTTGSKTKAPKIKAPKTLSPKYNENDYLDGKYAAARPTAKTKDLWFQLKASIEDMFNDVELKQKKTHAGYYLRDSSFAVCTLYTTKNKVVLNYSITQNGILDKSEFVEDVTNIGHWGIGDFRSHIKSMDDIQRAIHFIRQTYEFTKYRLKTKKQN